MPNWGTLRGPRLGIMLHFTGEAKQADAALIEWMRHGADCRVSYNWLVSDDGSQDGIAPMDCRAWHAGVCRSSHPRLVYTDANSAFYGLALITGPGAPVTQFAYRTLLRVCREVFTDQGWSPTETWRLTGHDREAWPRGRKIDPTGLDARHPILAVAQLQRDLPW